MFTYTESDESSCNEESCSPLVPLCDVEIPPEFLRPQFTDRGREKPREEWDIFSFGSKSVKKVWEECAKVFLRHRKPLKPDKYGYN